MRPQPMAKNNKSKRRKRRIAAGKGFLNLLNMSRSGGQSFQNDPSELKHRDMTTRTYQMRSDSWNDKNRTVEAVLATETVVRVFDWNNWEVLDEVLLMSGVRIPENGQVPLQDTHDCSTILKTLGSTRNIRVEGNQLVGTRHIDTTEEGEKAAIKIREKHITDGSIGYRVNESVIIEAGETAEVGGRMYTAHARYRLRIASVWTLKEDSLCPIGADGLAKMRSHSEPQESHQERKESTMGFEQWAKSRNFDLSRMSTAEITTLRTLYNSNAEATREEALEAIFNSRVASPEAPGTPATAAPAGQPAGERSGGVDREAMKQATRDALREEREEQAQRRTDEITTLAKLAGVSDEVRNTAIADTARSMDQVREDFRAAMSGARPRVAHAPAAHTRNVEIDTRHLEAALLMRCGDTDIVLNDPMMGEQVVDGARDFVGISMPDLMQECCRMDGLAWPSSRRFGNDHIRAGMSSISLPGILSNTANKRMLKTFKAAQRIAQVLCSRGDLSDFKESPRYSLTLTGGFQKLEANGELKAVSLTEESATNKLETRGMIIDITREMIINDDMSFLTKLPGQIANNCSNMIEKAFFVRLLLNPGSMFKTANANYLAGADTALSIAALKVAVQMFMDQVDKNKLPISINPKYLLVPTDLMFAANEYTSSEYVTATGSTDKTGIPTKNSLLQCGLQPLASPWMKNSTITGYSTKAWYLFADPNDADTFELAFLDGRDAPVIEYGDADFKNLGISLRSYCDFGIREQGHRGIVKMKGEA